MTTLEALLIAHIVLNIIILALVVIIEVRLGGMKETLYRLFDKVYFMRLALERVEKRVEELNEKVAG